MKSNKCLANVWQLYKIDLLLNIYKLFIQNGICSIPIKK